MVGMKKGGIPEKYLKIFEEAFRYLGKDSLWHARESFSF